MKKPRITMDRWGKDHWSTLAYLEVRGVENGGTVNNLHLRVDVDRHPAFYHPRKPHSTGKDYPTRLKNGEEKNHDDIDCIEDFIAYGLVKWEGTGLNPIFVLTDLGMMVANALRNHKIEGGSFGNFEYEIPV